MAIDYQPYSVQQSIKSALHQIFQSSNDLILMKTKDHVLKVVFESKSGEDRIGFPCPLKQTEAMSALKAVEIALVATIADLQEARQSGSISLSVERMACSLFAAYLCTIDGMWKGHPDVATKLKGLL